MVIGAVNAVNTVNQCDQLLRKDRSTPMKPVTAYLLGAIGFLLCVGVGVYYLVPLSTAHFLSSHGPHYSDTKHAIVFFGLAVVCLIGARFAANSKAGARRRR